MITHNVEHTGHFLKEAVDFCMSFSMDYHPKWKKGYEIIGAKLLRKNYPVGWTEDKVELWEFTIRKKR